MAALPRFTGSVPERYERYMVPLLMAPCAGDLARRAAALHPQDILEVAAGTGVLTRELVSALDASAALTATDANPPMLAVAQALVAGDRAAWKIADVQALPFADASFDMVVSQFGIMFVPDKHAAFSEARRVLRRGGHYLFNTWLPIPDNPIGQAANAAMTRLYPVDTPAFFRVPFSYGDRARIEQDVRRAGFSGVQVECVEYESRIESPELAATALIEGTPMFHEVMDRGGPTFEEVRATMAEEIATRIGGPGARLPLGIVIVTAST